MTIPGNKNFVKQKNYKTQLQNKKKIQQDFLHLSKQVFRTASPESFGR